MNDIPVLEGFLFTTEQFRKRIVVECREIDSRLRERKLRFVDGREILSRFIGQSIGFRIGVLLSRFVAALLTILITGSRGLIASRAWVIVVMCRCTPALLHVSTPYLIRLEQFPEATRRLRNNCPLQNTLSSKPDIVSRAVL